MSFRSRDWFICICAADDRCYEADFQCEVEDVSILKDIVESCYAFNA